MGVLFLGFEKYDSMEFIMQPWPWYVSGPLIALVMFFLIFSGRNFGMSGNLRIMCAALSGDKACDFFRFDWKAQRWNLVFALGAILGGFVAAEFLKHRNSSSNYRRYHRKTNPVWFYRRRSRLSPRTTIQYRFT